MKAARTVLERLVLVAMLAMSLTAFTSTREATPAPTDIAQAILQLTNQARLDAGLEPLTLEPRLDAAAQAHAQAMAAGDFMAHENPHTGSSPETRLEEVGYAWSAYGENVAAGQGSPAEVMADWMASPGHRANILSPDFQELGVGYYLDVDDQYPAMDQAYRLYWVQSFGSPILDQVTSPRGSLDRPAAGAQADGTPTPDQTPTGPGSLEASTGIVTMTVSASTTTAQVGDPVTVEIRLSGDQLQCGQSIVVKPVDVILVLDNSGSMSGEPLAQAKTAANAFVAEMNLTTDRVGVVQFSDSAQLLQDLTVDAAALTAAIDGIGDGGGTAIDQGLVEGFDALQRARRDGSTPIIVLLSDGASDPLAAVRAADTAKAAGIRVVTVGLGGILPEVLQAVASPDEKGQPQFYAAPDPASLKDIYVSIARNIREYGLASQLTLRHQVDLYKYEVVPQSVTPEGTIAGNTITWQSDVLEGGDTVFSYQARARQGGDAFDIGELTEASFLECEQDQRLLQAGPGPRVMIADQPVTYPPAPTPCEPWQLFPWWLLVALLLLVVAVLVLWFTPGGRAFRQRVLDRPWVCRLLALLLALYSVLLVTLIAWALQGDLCGADTVVFWKITGRDGHVGLYRSTFGQSDAQPMTSVNRDAGCVACHAATTTQQTLGVVRNDQNGPVELQTLMGALVNAPSVQASFMAWSPDGTLLAVSLNDQDIAVLDLETGSLTPLAGASDPNWIETMPAWSADGQTLAFVRATQTAPNRPAQLTGPTDILTIPATGGTALPLIGASGDGLNYYPAYSPDGRWLAFTRHTDGVDTYADDAADLYIVPAMGGERTFLLANSDRADSWPSWSSDGAWLGFSSNRLDQQFDIFVTQISAAGQSTQVYILPAAAATTDEEHHPVWVAAHSVPWWQRLLDLWPWLLPLPILLGLAWFFCRERRYSLTVNVTDARTREPLPGASIQLLETKIAAQTTDASGSVRVRVPIGRIMAAAEAVGYRPQSLAIDVHADTHLAFRLYKQVAPISAKEPPERLASWSLPPVWQPEPALIIGLGGTGRHVLTHLKKNLLDAGAGQLSDSVRLVLLDTADYELLEGQAVPVEFAGVTLSAADIVEFGEDLTSARDAILADPQAEPEIREWFPAAEYQTHLSADDLNLAHGTRQRRPTARAAIVRDVRQGASLQEVNIVLALDRSSSMNETFTGPGEPLSKLEAAKIAASQFVDQLNLAVDRVAVIGFNDTATVTLPLSQNAQAAKQAIQGLEAGGQTALHAALNAAETLLNTPETANTVRVVVLLSDGQSASELALSAAQPLKEAGIRVVTIGLGEVKNEPLLRELATDQVAGYFHAPSPDDLADIYVSLARDIGAGSRLWRLIHSGAHAALTKDQLRVIVVGSLAGGFGSAILADVAYLARRAGQRVGARSLSVEAYLATDGVFSRVATRHDVTAANTFAAVRELERFQLAQGQPFPMIYRSGQIDDPVLGGTIDWRLLDEVYVFDSLPDVPPVVDAQASAIDDPRTGVFPAMADAIYTRLDTATHVGPYAALRRGVQGDITAEQRATGRAAIGGLGSYVYRLPMLEVVEELKTRWAQAVVRRLVLGESVGRLTLDLMRNREEQRDGIDLHVQDVLLGQAGYQRADGTLTAPLALLLLGRLFSEGLTAGVINELEELAASSIEESQQAFREYLGHVILTVLNGHKETALATARSGKLGYAMAFLEHVAQALDQVVQAASTPPVGASQKLLEALEQLTPMARVFRQTTESFRQDLREQAGLLSVQLESTSSPSRADGLLERLAQQEARARERLDHMDAVLTRTYIHTPDLLDRWYKTYFNAPARDEADDPLSRFFWRTDDQGHICLTVTTWNRPAWLRSGDAERATFTAALLQLGDYMARDLWRTETLATVLSQTALHPNQLADTADRLRTGSRPLLRFDEIKATHARSGMVMGVNTTVQPANALEDELKTSLANDRQWVRVSITDPFALYVVQTIDVVPVSAVRSIEQAGEVYRRWYGLVPGQPADPRAETTAVFRAERSALLLEKRLAPELRQSPRFLRPTVVTALNAGGVARYFALAVAAGWLSRTSLGYGLQWPGSGMTPIALTAMTEINEGNHPAVAVLVRFASRAKPDDWAAVQSALAAAGPEVVTTWRQWASPTWSALPLAHELMRSGSESADLASLIALAARDEIARRRASGEDGGG